MSDDAKVVAKVLFLVFGLPALYALIGWCTGVHVFKMNPYDPAANWFPSALFWPAYWFGQVLWGIVP